MDRFILMCPQIKAHGRLLCYIEVSHTSGVGLSLYHHSLNLVSQHAFFCYEESLKWDKPVCFDFQGSQKGFYG